MASPARSPTRSPAPTLRSPLPAESPKESAISRLFLTPLTFLSFLLSLALIDAQNTRSRLQSHTHTHSPSRSRAEAIGFLGRVKEWVHKCVWREVGEPYAWVRSPDADVKVGAEREGTKGREEEPWHWRTKQKKMMKAEIADAFKVRKWIVVVLVLGMVCTMTGGVIVLRGVMGMGRQWVEGRGI